MKISYNWLKQYINVDLPVDEVAGYLTNSGLEVEGVEKFYSVEGGLEGLVVGEVIEAEQHPNADRLKVTKVDTGDGHLLDIVCGAPNVAAGQKVVVARVGTTLHPVEGDPFKIKKGKIRGAVSEGMICAEDEIGVGTDHDGIMVLDEQAKPGDPVINYLPVEEDDVIEIGLTPNRAEAASHIGTARDLLALSVTINALKGVELHIPEVDDKFKVDNHDLTIPVEVENTDACHRYSGLTMTGVKVAESPAWLQNRLRAIGLTPINNIVDISNFVLHETGQPLHIFDADRIAGKKVVVKTVKAGTPFVTLDEQERKLSDKDLMICDAEKPMCIAGVFGGLTSGVSDKTVNIFIESANFDAVWIRKTAKRHGLNTDASFRFERGVDPNMTVYALKRAALLIREIAGGKISSEIVDVYPQEIAPATVNLRYAQCDRIIGKKLDRELIKRILLKLGMEILEEPETGLLIKIPLYRVDVTREIDVIEEILRIYGYDNVEIPGQYLSSVAVSDGPVREVMLNKISDFLSGQGFMEAKSNSLTASAYYEQRKTYPVKRCVRIRNPLSKELNVLRQTLLFDALEAVRYNQNRQVTDLKLYESGKVYWLDNGSVREKSMLSIMLTGRRYDESWMAGKDEVSVFDLSGVLDALWQLFNFEGGRIRMEETEPNELIEYGIRFTLGERTMAVAGKVDRELAAAFDLRHDVFYAEIDWDFFTDEAHKNRIVYRPVPKYPSVRRDLSLLLDREVKFAEIETIARNTERKLLESVNLFDVYEGKNLPEGKKSYAVSFVFRDRNKTLRDKQIDKIMSKILANIQRETGAELR